MSYPNIILITDSVPSANGGGISQTLYNLLNHYPGKIWTITHAHEKQSGGLSFNTTIIPIGLEKIKPIKNRIGRLINPLIMRINHWALDRKEYKLTDISNQPNNLIMVSTTESIKLHLAFCIQKQLSCQILPYFMDDWIYDKQISWISGNIQQLVKDIHKNAKAWLMISENLHQTFLKRYQLQDKPCLIVHNPVPVTFSQRSSDNSVDDGLIIYAGSIWPMHLDAIIVTAKAVAHLQKSGLSKYRLLIHTTPSVWESYKEILLMPGVSYGGLLSYDQLPEHLQRGWLLLVPASFELKNRGFTLSSIQTKLTDYMSVARPVLYVGPSEGASGKFVQKWDCGFNFNTQDHTNLAKQLQEIMNNKKSWLSKANNGKQAVVEHFNQESVQKKLYHFLKQYY